VNQEAIAKHFMLDKGSIAKTLSKLEEKALINRVDNPNNKREKLITITELGRENSYTYQDEIHEFHNFLLEGLTMEEINEFTRIIEIMTQNAIKAVQGRMDVYDSAE
jgi:DNA-binding MarR family transcriptional regulator